MKHAHAKKMSFARRFLYLLFYLAALALLIHSSCQQVKDPITAAQFTAARTASLFSSADPLDRRIFYHDENILFSMEELYPREQTDIQIIRVSDGEILRRLLVISDEQGRLVRLPIWHFINYQYRRPEEPRIESSGKLMIHLEQPGLGRPWKIYRIPFEIRDEPPPFARIRLLDADGRFCAGSIRSGMPVCVAGSGLRPQQAFRLLVVADQRRYASGEAYVDLSGAIEEVTAGRDGLFPSTAVWESSLPGAYDVVADAAPFGVVSEGDLISEIPLTGLVVQAPPAEIDLIQDIACDASGLHKDLFDSAEVVYVRVNSHSKPQRGSEYVNLFITPHRDSWQEGDSLAAIRTVGTHEMPLQLIWNGAAAALPLTLARGPALPGDPRPAALWPGEYDIILDMDRSYTYERGEDLLDGGPRPGFTVPGRVPAVRLFASADIDFLGRRQDERAPALWGYWRDQAETRIWATLIDSLNRPLPEIPVTFSITEGFGRLSRGEHVTNQRGMAWSLFSGGQWGRGTTVRVEAVVRHVRHAAEVVIFVKIPYSHNQGILIGGGGPFSGALNGF